MKEYAKHKGFTLVELLIVIVVIGVLSAMMMLSSTEAVSSARAAAIISDLRNLKTAALAYYADNLDEIDAVEGNIFKEADKTKYYDHIAKVFQYLGNADKIRVDDGAEEYRYSFGSETHTADEFYGGAWYVWCKVKEDSKVREKLESRKTSVGLVGARNKAYHGNPANVENFVASDKGIKYVGLRIK